MRKITRARGKMRGTRKKSYENRAFDCREINEIRDNIRTQTHVSVESIFYNKIRKKLKGRGIWTSLQQ